MVSVFAVSASASDITGRNIPGWSGVTISADIDFVEYSSTPNAVMPRTGTTISADEYLTFGSYYFGSTSKKITVTTSTASGFSLSVWLQNSTGDIVGPQNMVRNSSGSATWTVRPSASDTYTLYIYNNSSSDVSVSVSVS
jgi:hypothetical protein